MSEGNDQSSEAYELPVTEEARWIERLTDAASDYETVDAEAAAGLGL